MFFGVADQIATISIRDFTKCLIIRMRGVPAIDATALHTMEELFDRCEKNGVTIIFSHVNEQPYNVMKKAGFVDRVGEENFCAHIDLALARAEELI